MRVAIVGAGVSGLVCAHLLQGDHDVAVLEAAPRIGGHANTVEVELGGQVIGVDTGFIVYNDRNYPLFSRLLGELGVATTKSDMSFSVTGRERDFEYRPTNLDTVFAQRSNLLRPSFHRMLIDIARFNRAARHLLAEGDHETTLGELLGRGRLSPRLRDHFVVPLGASIWSADPAHFAEMPAATYARFMDNHGLLSFGDQPRWRTVAGGSRRYLEALTRPFADRIRCSSPIDKVVRRAGEVELHLARGGVERYDAVVLATHADQSLRLLSDPTPEERAVLSAIRYQENLAILHTDARLLPRRRRCWASWNYHLLDEATGAVAVTYHLNRLQSLSAPEELLVTLNQETAIDPARVIARFAYAHPVLDRDAVRAQTRLGAIQGRAGTYFCGAWAGYGFHEDGVRSAHGAVEALRRAA